MMGLWDEAMEQFWKTFEIAPDFIQGHYFLAQAYMWKKSYPEALAEAQKVGPSDSALAVGLRGNISGFRAEGQKRLPPSLN
jgi:hypothetical protein